MRVERNSGVARSAIAEEISKEVSDEDLCLGELAGIYAQSKRRTSNDLPGSEDR